MKTRSRSNFCRIHDNLIHFSIHFYHDMFCHVLSIFHGLKQGPAVPMHGMVRSWFGGTGGSVRQDTTIRISSVNNIQFLGTVNCCSPGAAWRLIQSHYGPFEYWNPWWLGSISRFSRNLHFWIRLRFSPSHQWYHWFRHLEGLVMVSFSWQVHKFCPRPGWLESPGIL